MADRRLRRHLSQDEMNRGIGILHSGLSQRHVANALGVSQSVVSRMWNRFITTGNVRRLHVGGRECSTNEVQDRFLVVQARRHRFDNATTLRRDFQNATGVRISTQTVRKSVAWCWPEVKTTCNPGSVDPISRANAFSMGTGSCHLDPKWLGPSPVYRLVQVLCGLYR